MPGLTKNLLPYNKSDQVGNKINLIIINFVWVLPFIYTFTESPGIIFLICMSVKKEEAENTAQNREITNFSIIKGKLVSGTRSSI